MTEEQKNEILCTAAKVGSTEIIKYLIEKYPEIPVDYTDACEHACWKKNSETAIFLLEMGADSQSALSQACRYGSENIIRYLLETVLSININIKRYYDNGSLRDSNLLSAASSGCVNICKLLISSGAIIDDSFQHQSSKRWKSELKIIPCHDILIKYRSKNISEIALELSDKLIYSSSKKEREKVIEELNQLVSEYPIVGNIIETNINKSKNDD